MNEYMASDILSKKCEICGIGSEKIKYCSTKCSYRAMDIKQKKRASMNKRCNCNGRMFWVSSMTMWGFLIGLAFGLAIAL